MELIQKSAATSDPFTVVNAIFSVPAIVTAVKANILSELNHNMSVLCHVKDQFSVLQQRRKIDKVLDGKLMRDIIVEMDEKLVYLVFVF